MMMLPDIHLIYMRVCVHASDYMYLCLSVYVYVCVFVLACRCACALGHFVCLSVYEHIFISPCDVAVNFFGVTENDLELLLLVHMSDSGNGSGCVCVCVCMHNVQKSYLMLSA